MSDEPYIPFYKPYGMTDEEFQHEVMLAQERHAEWKSEQAYEAWVEELAKECTLLS